MVIRTAFLNEQTVADESAPLHASQSSYLYRIISAAKIS